MNNKKKLWWLALPTGIAALCFGFYSLVNYIAPPLADDYPKKSIKNEFMLYNDGCCFCLDDFAIWLSDESGETYPFFRHSSPPLWKRLNSEFPQSISGSIQAVVSFSNEYSHVAGHPEFTIMDFESLDVLKKDGLLLIFGDGTLEVKSGEREVLFSYDKAPWADETQHTQIIEPQALTWREAYAELLRDYMAQNIVQSDPVYFLLLDIDKDGIPELVVVGGDFTDSWDDYTDVTYTFKNGNVLSLEYADGVSLVGYALSATCGMTLMPGGEPGLQTYAIGASAGVFGANAWYQIIVVDGDRLVIGTHGMRYVDVEALNEMFDDFGRSIDDYNALEIAIEEHTYYYINDNAVSEDELYNVFFDGEEIMRYRITEDNIHDIVITSPQY